MHFMDIPLLFVHVVPHNQTVTAQQDREKTKRNSPLIQTQITVCNSYLLLSFVVVYFLEDRTVTFLTLIVQFG